MGQGRVSDPAGASRRRLARTLSGSRWSEYRSLLKDALAAGYSLVSLEEWVASGRPIDAPLMILRHDVDQHPRTALRMARAEVDLGVNSTWYFRWRTASRPVIESLRASGFGIGFHYETLSRLTLERCGGTIGPEIEEARNVLREELASFHREYGPIRSACPHGDSRVPHVNNGALLRGEDCRSYGIEFDGNEVMRGVRLGCWLTDRSASDGGWAGGARPAALFSEGVTPILCLTHPNNWTSGASLWVDRVLRSALGARGPVRPIRTLGDRPR